MPACVSSYTSALGYRARHAAMEGDIEVFDELMAEAADTRPNHTFDNPKRTVLTHFLDFGGSERFFPMLEAWKKNGWIDDNMTCAIHRARFRGVAARDPEEADRAADVCLDRARAAAGDPDRRWEIDACLEEAPFLTVTATAPLMRFADLAADAAEPILFRAALLEGMTTMYLQDPGILRSNDPAMPKEAAIQRSRAQLTEVTHRFEAILDRARPNAETTLIAGSTAFGAMELERVHLAHGRSFAGRFAASELADDTDLAWAWVRALKAKKRMARIEGLGFWDRKREPAGDAFWYLCTGEPKKSSGKLHVSAISLLARQAGSDAAAIREKECAKLAHIAGPFPLEATARGTITSSISQKHGGAEVEIHLDRRVWLRLDPPSG